MGTITGHIFIHIFQMEHSSSVKFDISYEKNMNFLVVPNLQKLVKKLKIGLGSFNFVAASVYDQYYD